MAISTKAKPSALSVSLEPSPQAAEGVSLLQKAQGLTITDRVSHEVARTFLKCAKELKRKVVEHFKRIKDPINAARNTVLDMERETLAPIDAAIALAEKVDTAYVRETERREQEAADRRRREEEAKEQARRDKEAAEAEAAAEKLEASSTLLSAREQKVIARLMAGSSIDRTSLRGWMNAAIYAEYKNPNLVAPRLMQSAKLNEALDAAIKAAEIRRQSEAAKAAPILVDVQPVETEIAKVSGTSVRSYYGCDPQVDLKRLIGACLSGKVPMDAIQPNMVHLNAQARSLKELFPQAYSGCQLTKREGITG